MRSARGIMVVATAIVLLVGIPSLLSGCSTTRKSGTATLPTVKLAVSSDPPDAPLRFVSKLALSWGAKRGVAVDGSGSGFETSFVGRGGTYIVDHPGSPPGARVRRFVHGALRGTYHAPPSSFSFMADGDGFSYVIGNKTKTGNMRVVTVGARGTNKATYTIPMGLNSGGLRRVGDTLYTVAWSGKYDQNTATTEGNDVLVPISIRGRQVTQLQATHGAVNARWMDAQGNRWQHTTRLAYLQDPENYIVTGNARVRIPNDAALLGVDARRRTWVAFAPRALTTRGSAGWPSRTDETALLVAFDMQGVVQGVMPLRAPTGIAASGIPLDRRVSFDGRYLSFQDMTPAGVTVYAFEVNQ